MFVQVCTHSHDWRTAFSNNVMKAGKHYAMFDAKKSSQRDVGVLVGLMRPGQADQNANGIPFHSLFFQHFSPYMGEEEISSSKVQCCMYYSNSGKCCISNWRDPGDFYGDWEGMERSSPEKESIGMLFDLDKGTLSVYRNGRKLGVMKRGLIGPYCWVASMSRGAQVTIKRGTIPPS